MRNEAEELAIFPALLNGVELFVDVGANRGAYTFAAAASGYVRGVLAIEADPTNAAFLTQMAMKWNRESSAPVTVITAVAGDGVEPVIFYRSAHHTKGSLTRSDHTVEVIPVRQVRLDRLVPPGLATLFKIDVEGAEYRVLQGAKGLFEARNSSFLIEIHGWGDPERRTYPLDVFKFLRRYNFDVEPVGSLYFFKPARARKPHGYASVLPLATVKTVLYKYMPSYIPLIRRLTAPFVSMLKSARMVPPR